MFSSQFIGTSLAALSSSKGTFQFFLLQTIHRVYRCCAVELSQETHVLPIGMPCLTNNKVEVENYGYIFYKFTSESIGRIRWTWRVLVQHEQQKTRQAGTEGEWSLQ